MHKNYGAAVAKGSHRIIFGTIRKENTEILQEKTKRIIPVFGDTFVSAKGYALSPSSSRKLLANMRINLRRQTEKLATQLNIEYIFERPEEKILLQIEEYEKGELISIIVPIYNVENYLRQCLDSIMSQTYQNFECLLINDGSPDNSADICREYVEKDSRFKYFEKENGGVSSARNLGIERSGGAYITFIDSDDLVESDYLEVLYKVLKDEAADISVLTYKQFDMAGNCYYVHSYQRGYEKRVFVHDEFISELPLLERYDRSFGYSTGKLVSRNMLGNVRFNEVTTLSEDMEFWYKVYLFSYKVVYVNRDAYIYRTYGDLKNYSTEAIRSDIQQRLNFLTFLGVRGVNNHSYIENFITHLKWRIEEQVKQGLGDTETTRWLKETLFLIDIGGKNFNGSRIN